jgi:hypothetical protein
MRCHEGKFQLPLKYIDHNTGSRDNAYLSHTVVITRHELAAGNLGVSPSCRPLLASKCILRHEYDTARQQAPWSRASNGRNASQYQMMLTLQRNNTWKARALLARTRYRARVLTYIARSRERRVTWYAAAHSRRLLHFGLHLIRGDRV